MTKISRLVRRVKAAGGATRTRFRDRSRAAGRWVHAIAAKLRLRGAQARDEAQAGVLRVTGELAGLAERAAAAAAGVLVNARDPDAHPIAKGRLGKPVEFGYKAQVVDNEDGIVLDYTVEEGNPPDAPQNGILAHNLVKITALAAATT